MIPCIYNLVSIPTLFERHIEGLAGIFYFYFTYFLSFNFHLYKQNNPEYFFIYYVQLQFINYVFINLTFHSSKENRRSLPSSI